MIPSEYKGKPQAFVKHELLKAYLECLFMIVGKGHPVISYIDCFAGPWTEGTESLDATSISLSLRIMRKCSESLTKMGYNARFRALYIEKVPVAYPDPTEKHPTPFKRQTEVGLRPYTVSGQRSLNVSSRLYLTHHPLGIVKFMEASKKLDLVQRKVHEQAKQEKRIGATGQGELFAAHEQVPEKDGRVGLDEVKDYWLRILSLRPQLFGIENLADILEETGWFETNLQEAFGELQREGTVENLDASHPRRTRFVHFEANGQKGERLQKVKS